MLETFLFGTRFETSLTLLNAFFGGKVVGVLQLEIDSGSAMSLAEGVTGTTTMRITDTITTIVGKKILVATSTAGVEVVDEDEGVGAAEDAAGALSTAGMTETIKTTTTRIRATRSKSTTVGMLRINDGF